MVAGEARPIEVSPGEEAPDEKKGQHLLSLFFLRDRAGSATLPLSRLDGLQADYVFRLGAFSALGDGKLDLLAFSQGLEA